MIRLRRASSTRRQGTVIDTSLGGGTGGGEDTSPPVAASRKRGRPRRVTARVPQRRRSARPAVRYRRFGRQNPSTDRRKDSLADEPDHRERRHRRDADRPGTRAREGPGHPGHGQERRHRRLGHRDDHRADDARLPAQGRDRAHDARRARRRSARPGSTSPGARWSAARSRARPSSWSRASRTSSRSRRARAASARARSASTWPSPSPSRAPSVGLLDADITGPNIPLMLGPRGPAEGERQQQDPAARAPRREGHLDPVLRARGPADRLARPARRRRDPAVPARRRVGRARLPRHRPAARAPRTPS